MAPRTGRQRARPCGVCVAGLLGWSVSPGLNRAQAFQPDDIVDASSNSIEQLGIAAAFLLLCLVIAVTVSFRRRARAVKAEKESIGQLASRHQWRIRDFGTLSGACLWELGPGLHYAYVSDNSGDILGISPQELVGKLPWACGDLARSSGVSEEMRRLLQSRGSIRGFIYTAEDAHGNRRKLRVNATPLLDAAGVVAGYRGITTDITAEDEAKRQAEQAHLRLCDAIEHIPAAIMLVDSNDRLALWNSQVGRYFTDARALFIPGTPYSKILAAIAGRCRSANSLQDPSWLQRRVAESRTSDEPAEPIQLADGRWMQFLDRPTSDGGTVSIWIDVTAIEERKAEFASKWQLLRATLDNIIQGVTLFDKDLRLAVWNERYFKLLGFPLELAKVGTPIESFVRYKAESGRFGPVDVEEIVAKRVDQVRRREPFSIDHFEPDGTIAEIHVAPIAKGGVVFTCTDVTDRKRREAEMREKSRLLQATFDSIGEGISVFDKDLCLVAWNDKFRELLDLPKAMFERGTTYKDILQYQASHAEFGADDCRDEIARRLTETLKRNPQHYVRQRPNGRYVEVRRNPIPDGGFVTTYADVTDAKTTQAGLIRAQKMEAIGHLAGGVAHEFNNLLTAIGGFARMAVRRADDAEHVKECVGEVVSASDRAATLTRQLLAYSRKQVLAATTVNVAELVAETAKMLGPLLGETIKIDTELGATETAITVDKDQLSQALVNLAVNARDAMAEGGRLTIRTGIEHLTEADLTLSESCRPGNYAFVSMMDTGCGMTKDIAERVFEPFFTTKEPGKGTGLGLAMVQGFVEQSHGALKLKTAPGQGTAITIYLPLGNPNDQKIDDVTVQSEELPALGKRTILLVEDEDAVRRYFKRELESLGYTALIATSGEDALRLESEHPGPIDAVVTDVVMPGIGGIETARCLRERRPNIKVVYMSGYIRRDPFDDNELGADRVFLDKPFPIERLLLTLNELFEGDTAASPEGRMDAAE